MRQQHRTYVWVRVIPLGTKMRQKVKQYGEVWKALRYDEDRTHIATATAVHAGGHPYETWVSPDEARLERIK